MKKDNKIWLPLVIVLGVLVVGLFIASAVVNNTIGKHEAKKGSGEVLTASDVIDAVTEDSQEPYPVGAVSIYLEETLEVIPVLESTTRYIINDNPYYSEYNEDTLKGLTAEELYYAFYEIYAKTGCCFEDAKLQEYFNSKTWYYNYNKKTADLDADLANAFWSSDLTLKANIEFVSKYISDNNLTFTP